MKYSEITLSDVKEYLRVDDDDDDKMLESILLSAKSFIKNYTMLSEEELDQLDEISIAILILCSDMYDNRQFSIDKNCSLNSAIDLIFKTHVRHSL